MVPTAHNRKLREARGNRAEGLDSVQKRVSSPEGRRDAYLSAGEVMVSRHDLRPAVEGPVGWKRLPLDVVARLGNVPLAVPVALAALATLAAMARLCFVCMRRHG